MIDRILKTKERNIYDYAFIGASPAMIARANYYSFLGKKVALIDKYKELGGSWRLISPFKDGLRYDCLERYLAGGFQSKKILREYGCQINTRTLIYLFKDNLRIFEKKMIFEIFKPKINYFQKMGKFTFLPASEGEFIFLLRKGNIGKEEIKIYREKLKTIEGRKIRREADVNLYFVENTDNLLKPLENRAIDYKVSIYKNTNVKKININTEFVKISGEFRNIFSSNVILGTYYNGKIFKNNREIKYKKNKDKRLTLLIRVYSKRKQKYKYIKFQGWKHIRALQDVSSTNEPKNRSTFSLFLNPYERFAKEKDINYFFNLLKKLKILNDDSNIEKYYWYNYSYSKGIDSIKEKLLKIAHNRVTYLYISNLGIDIVKNPKIWRIALTKTSFIDKLTTYFKKRRFK